MFKEATFNSGCKRKTAALLLWLAGAALASPANADTQLLITGNIKPSPCKIDQPAGGWDVDLGKNIMSTSLSTAGSSTNWVPFSIELIDCPAATTEATMTLNGTADAVESNMYANTGTASRVQIEVQSSAGDVLGNAAKMVQPIDSSSRSTKFEMLARVYSAEGNATPGTIAGIMQVTFTYR